jgi:hypothetical protein
MPTSTRAIPTTPAAFLTWENRQRLRYELVGGAAAIRISGLGVRLPLVDLYAGLVSAGPGDR